MRELSEKAKEKQIRWEHKLLDISARSSLLHIPCTETGHKALLFTGTEPAELFRRAASGETLRLCGWPEKEIPETGFFLGEIPVPEKEEERESGGNPGDEGTGEREETDPFAAASSAALFGCRKEAELSRALTALKKDAVEWIAQTGSRALYLTFGSLKWRDPKSLLSYHAPLLLLPIELEKQGKLWRIRCSGDPVVFNDAIPELLRSKFEIQLKAEKNQQESGRESGSLYLPADKKSGAASPGTRVFAWISEAIQGQEGLSLHRNLSLGLYTFGNVALWQDLKDNRERFAENPLVASILEGRLFPEVNENAEEVPEEEVLLPLTADATQLGAVRAALSGQSFVMHGPPGTGKSQTITVMLTNLICREKQVVFAAEKEAALDVVYERLKKTGLAPFCLYLSAGSTKSSEKADFLAQMQEALSVLSGPESRFEEAKERLREAEAALQEQLRQLHGRRVCGYSAYQLLSEYMKVEEDRLDIRLEEEFIETLSREQIELYEDILRRVSAARDLLREMPENHPLKEWGSYSYTPGMQQSLRPALENYANSLMLIRRFGQQSCELLGLPFREEKAFLLSVRKAAGLALQQGSVPVRRSSRVQDADQALYEISQGIRPGSSESAGTPSLSREETEIVLLPLSEEGRKILNNFCQSMDLLAATGKTAAEKCPVILPFFQNTEEKTNLLEEKARRWISGLDSLREWSDYARVRQEALDRQLTPFLQKLEAGEEAEQVLRSFHACVYYTLLNRMYETSAEVRAFTGYRMEELVARFATAHKAYVKASAAWAGELLTRQAKEAREAQGLALEMTRLRKMIESRGKGMSVRQMLEAIPLLLRKLKPCILIDPVSAARNLSPGLPLFDAVVFDEASQLRTCRAIGLLARSRQAVVGGDPNQMPPTTFFDTTVEDETVAPLEEDQESILNDCIALGLPEHVLRWHYRSHHESLIAFSNERYYEGKMVTFPSVDNRISRVRLIPVEGLYERGAGMRNRPEAEAVTAYVKERIAGGDTRSYGIVTFNKNQKDLLDRLLEKAAEEDAAFEEALGLLEERGEPLFVRNLESVQGDERDVILFSVGYGPDEEGRLPTSFGPLAMAGGYRRLNVAITRARDEMVLFSSLPVERMKTGENTARAVKDFFDFLRFAKGDRGQEETAVRETESLPDGFQRIVAEYVKSLGYECDLDVGCSGLKIDIGVLDPKNPGSYRLGILLNNTRFYENPSVYDREVGQLGLLEARGWKLLRLWSIDWWDDIHREETRIRDALG